MRQRAAKILLFLALAVLSVACKHDVEKEGGSFSFNGKTCNISHIRIENVGVMETGEFLIRFSAMPTTYNIDEKSEKGYGNVIDIYFKYPKEDLENGHFIAECYDNEEDSLFSTIFYIPAEGGDTLRKKANLIICDIDSTESFRKYQFTIALQNGKDVVGNFVGNYLYNYSYDKISYGVVDIDTIHAELAKPTIWKWGNLFSDKYRYHEMVFYSNDSRFMDKGSIISGTQLVIGFYSKSKKHPKAGVYQVDMTPNDFVVSAGFKSNNTPWGSWWQVYNNGSSVGKANISEGQVEVINIDNQTIELTFSFVDQLKNKIEGSYIGPYSSKQ